MRALLLILVLAAPDVEAQADALVQEGKLDQAFELLDKAYVKNKNPRLLFGMGVIKQKQGDCEDALSYFGRFIAAAPSEEAIAATKKRIEACEEAGEPTPAPVEAGPPPKQQPKPSPSEPTAAPPRSAAEAEPSPEPGPRQAPPKKDVWYRDKAGWALLASGLLVSAAGGGLLAQGALDRKAARDADNEESFDLRFNRSRVFLGVGGTLTTIGVGLLVGAIVRYATAGRRKTSGVSRR